MEHSHSIKAVQRSQTSPRVLIVQDYVPEYRQPFFERLEANLDLRGIRLRVAIGQPSRELASRRDAILTMPFVQEARSRSATILGRQLSFKNVREITRSSDLIILGQSLHNLETSLLLLRQRRGGTRVAFWGHGATLVRPTTRLERALLWQLTQEAHWFFAYTRGGAEYVASSGFPGNRITVVQNTTDTQELIRMRNSVSNADTSRLRTELQLPDRGVCLFIGGLDASKRLGFLLDAGRSISKLIPAFTLIVAGDGADRHIVEQALASAPWLRYVGRVTGRRKAELGAVSDLLLIPGRVGLVAVDSFALQTPIVTTNWRHHAPEVEYLAHGVNACFTDDNVAAYVRATTELLLTQDRVKQLKAACASAADWYSLDYMVGNFAEGVTAALGAPRR